MRRYAASMVLVDVRVDAWRWISSNDTAPVLAVTCLCVLGRGRPKVLVDASLEVAGRQIM